MTADTQAIEAALRSNTYRHPQWWEDQCRQLLTRNARLTAALGEERQLREDRFACDTARLIELTADAATGRAVGRRLRDLAALLAAEVDLWGHGDMHYGPTPRDEGVLSALAAYRNTMEGDAAWLASLDEEEGT